MRTYRRFSIPGTTSWRLSVAALALLIVTGAQATLAVTYPVDFGGGCVVAAPDCSIDPCTPIEATVGVAIADTIEGATTGGLTPTWQFDTEPSGCSGSAPTFTCNGVVIDASSDPVTVSGTPTAGGSFTFALEGDIGSLCYGGFILNIKDPYDIVLVLDRSGSMSWTSFIGPPATDRWDALKRAVNNLTPIVTTSTCMADSNAALTFFSTNVLANNGFPAGLTPVTGTLATEVDTEMTSQEPPGGWTGLGSGVQNGIGKLTDATRKRVVMVFSDGEQNQDPEVNHLNGTEYLTGGLPSGTINPGGTGAFKIVTVGIGNPMGVYHDAMDRLGNNNDGTYLVTATGEDITAAMDAATTILLDGCSPQMVATYSGQLQGAVSLAPFDVNRKVSQLFIRLAYSRDFEIPNLVQLLGGVRIERDGVDITRFFRPIFVGNFTNSFTLVTDFTDPSSTSGGTSIPPEGTYTVQMVEPPNISPTLDYRAVVFADDQQLDMAWQVTPLAPRSGGSFEPSIDLTYFNAPLAGATVEALIRAPGDDLGNALGTNPLKVDPTGGEDAGTPGEQKFLELLNDADFLSQILPQDQQLLLQDQGDGSYTGSFSPAVSGVHQVLFRVSADHPAGFGKVQRQVQQSVYVRPAELDREASGMSANVDGNTIVWQFKPVTKQGFLWGPGQQNAISVAGTGVNVTDIRDDQFGGYGITLDGNPNSTVSVTLLGEEIYTGSAGGFGPTSGDDTDPDKMPRWLFWLILLLILIILIWIIKKLLR